jgi:hypothetical protein
MESAILGQYGQAESVHTIILTVKTQKWAVFYFWNFDLKFGFKTIKLLMQILISNQQEQVCIYIPLSISLGDKCMVNSTWAEQYRLEAKKREVLIWSQERGLAFHP